MHGKKTKKKEYTRNVSQSGARLTAETGTNSNKLEKIKQFTTGEHSTKKHTATYGVQISTVLGTAFFCIYLKTLYPSIPGGDSGELIPSAFELGVAHPPGYPLFTLLSWCTINIIPTGSVAWKVNVLNAVFSGLSVSLLAVTVLRLSNSLSATVYAVGVWGLCKLTWNWSVTAEVFALNNFFVTLLLHVALKFAEAEDQEKEKRPPVLGEHISVEDCVVSQDRFHLSLAWKDIRNKNEIGMSVIGSFVCGLSLCNQHTIVIYVLVLAVWVMWELYTIRRLTFLTLVKQTLAFLAGLMPYIYLPISAYCNKARWTWGDQRTLSGFMKHLLRQEYGTFDLGKDMEGLGFLPGIRSYSSHLSDDLTPLTLILFGIGTVSMATRFRKEKSVVAVYWIMMVLYTSFFSWRANLNTQNLLYLGVVERFWMQSDIVVVIISALAYSNIYTWIQKKLSKPDKFHLDLIIAVIITLFQMQNNYAACDQSNNTVISEMGQQVLDMMPKNAIILTKGDLLSNSLRYLHLCENIRPDVQVFDQEILTYDWSVEMLAKSLPQIKFPGDLMHLQNGIMDDGRRSFNFKAFLDANYDHAQIYGCIGVQDHEPSWKPFYELWPFGVCERFIRRGQHVDVKQYFHSVQDIGRNWTYSLKQFDEKSWEKIGNDEMWNAKITLAFFLFDKSQTIDNQKLEEKTTYLQYSYKLYKNAIETNTNFPSYWHKNFALVCQHLLHMSHGLDRQDLLKQTCHHFQLYIDLEPSDKEAAAIRTVIKQLKEHLN